MSIIITDPRKPKFIEQDGAKITFIPPNRETILNCFYAVLGKDFDLAKFDPSQLRTIDAIRLTENVCKQSITDWIGVVDSEGTQIVYDQELIESIPIDLKMKIFNEVLGFLLVGLGLKKIEQDSQPVTIQDDSIQHVKTAKTKVMRH